MRLQYLSLTRIVDAAYWCGVNGTPVSILIAAPPGTGKTWAAESIRDTTGVLYLKHVKSPNEHRRSIADAAPRTKLLINDDLGLAARWNQSEFFSTFAMVADGEIEYTVYKQTQHARMTCSMLLICTYDYYNKTRHEMTGLGLHDRIVPVILGLSGTTRKHYQSAIIREATPREPPQRVPEILDKNPIQRAIAEEKDIEPRLLRNLQYLSQYLTEDEFCELIAIAHDNTRYEV